MGRSLQKITEQVYQISLGAVNCFLIRDGEGYALVDCGYEGSSPRIFKALDQLGGHPRDITCLILTHSHPDHAGSAAFLQRELEIPIIMHAEDADLARQGLAGRLPYVLSPGLLNRVLFHLFIAPKPNAIEPFVANRLVEGGEMIPIGDGIRVLHTPGHSAGHIVLLIGSEGLLLAGDICSNMAGLGWSIVYEDRAQGLASIRKIAQQAFSMACFGHGKPLMEQASQRLAARFSGPVIDHP